MDKEQAIKVIDILLMADNGCPACSLDLIERFIKEFHGFADDAKAMYVAKYGDHDFSKEVQYASRESERKLY